MSFPPFRTPLVSVLFSVITFFIAFYYFDASLFSVFIYTAISAYLPSYFDGSEHRCHSASGGRLWSDFQRLTIFRSVLRYFSAKIIVEVPFIPNNGLSDNEASAFDNEKLTHIPPSSLPSLSHSVDPSPAFISAYPRYILAMHPHGAITVGHVVTMTNGCNFLSRVFPLPRRDLAASILFRIPLLRELCLWLGCIDASASTAERALKGGYSLHIHTGGEREQVMTNHKKPLVYIKNRRGIARLSCKYGVPIVPSYTFNEDRLFTTYQFLLPLQLWIIKNFKMALTICTGRWGLAIPFQKPLLTVFGNHIKPPNIEREGSIKEILSNGVRVYHFNDEDVDRTLALYADEIKALFDRHKKNVEGYENNVLEVL